MQIVRADSTDTTHTLRATTDAALSRFLPPKELADAVRETVHGLLVRGRQAERDAGRLAFVVLSVAAADDSEPWAARWLTEQLSHLLARNVLPAFLHPRDGSATALCGELTPTSALLMIPRRMQKAEIDRLRDAVPTRFNLKAQPATTDGNRPIGRVDAWVFDERWKHVVERSDDLGGLVADVLGRCRAVAHALEDNIAAYRFGYGVDNAKEFPGGDWTTALSRIKRGLVRDRGNAYLQRKAAEFSNYLGDFKGAKEHADLAVKATEAVDTAYCLRGDALLGQGQIRRALREYRVAAEKAPRSPLPFYAAGMALLTVVRLLRAEGDKAAWSLIKEEPWEFDIGRDELINIEAHTTLLCAEAADALRLAQQRLANWGTPGLRALRNFITSPNAFALIQTEVLKINPAGAIQELETARKDYPRDDLLARELVFARMWNAGLSRRLFGVYGRIPAGALPIRDDNDAEVPEVPELPVFDLERLAKG